MPGGKLGQQASEVKSGRVSLESYDILMLVSRDGSSKPALSIPYLETNPSE